MSIPVSVCHKKRFQHISRPALSLLLGGSLTVIEPLNEEIAGAKAF